MANADRLIEVFNEAKARPAGAERERFLADACQGDAALKTQVISLLQAHEGAGNFLKNTIILSSTAVLGTEKPGDTIGRYKLLQVIGEGGCGVVYMAEQSEPVRRKVALKVIKLGMDTRHVVARFEAERQALALMDHPNIAKVFDAGATDAGRPYFVMELVRGIKITDYCDQNRLSTIERLNLFIQVCQAIQHAHQKGIIHRDIKPSNVLVAQHDTVAVPKVIDFGIAKATSDQPLTDKTLFTAFEQFMGTPAYMSPEQAQMSGLDIDTRTDIYSLGVLLYELLTGQTPFDPAEMMKSGLDAMRKTIRDKEPMRPSTRLTQELVAADVRRHTSKSQIRNQKSEMDGASSRRLLQVKELIPLLRGDLDWIVMKSLEKDRNRRYETANGLAADLKRHLNNEPVMARPPSTAYRFQKAFRRNKLAFTATAAVALLFVLGLAGVLWQWRQAEDARGIAVSKAAAETKAREGAEYESYVSTIALAASQLDRGALARANGALESCPLRLRHWEWAWLKQQCDSGPRISEGHSGEVLDVRFSPDGKHALIRSRHSVRLWDLEGDREGQLAATVVENRFTSFMRNPTEALVFDGAVLSVWSLENGQSLRRIRLGAGAGESIAHICATGERVFTTALNVYETGSGKLLSTLQPMGGPAQIKAVSANGRRALTAGRRLELWDTDAGRSVFAWPGDSNDCESAVFSPDAHRLFIQNYSQDASTPRRSPADVWDADTGRLIASLRRRGGTTESPLHALFAPDGRRLLTTRGISVAIAEVWDAETGRLLTTFEGHTNQIPNRIDAMAFSPDGRTVCTTDGQSLESHDGPWNDDRGRAALVFRVHCQGLGRHNGS